MNIDSRIDSLQRWVISREAQRDMINKSIDESNSALLSLNVEHDLIEKSIIILQKLAEIKRQTSTERIENLVTFGLQSVLSQDIRFRIKQKDFGNQVISDFVIEYGSGDKIYEVDLMDGEGGGVVKLSEFLLKLIVILMLKPPMRRFMVCDENFAMVSRGNIGRLCELLRELAAKMEFQFLMVTHQIELEAAADKLYRVDKPFVDSRLTRAQN